MSDRPKCYIKIEFTNRNVIGAISGSPCYVSIAKDIDVETEWHRIRGIYAMQFGCDVANNGNSTFKLTIKQLMCIGNGSVSKVTDLEVSDIDTSPEIDGVFYEIIGDYEPIHEMLKVPDSRPSDPGKLDDWRHMFYLPDSLG